MRIYLVPLLLVCLLVLPQVLGQTTAPVDSLDCDLGPVSDFTLLDQNGNRVRRADLQGKVWVVSFFFTCCDDTCPTLTSHMARLQKSLADCPDVRLVSISVQPKKDTSEVLGKFARNHKANPERWLFLTGDEKNIYQLVEKGFFQGAQPNPDGLGVVHSNNLVVVDRKGQIRGYVDGLKEENVYRLEQKVRGLLEPEVEPQTPQASIMPAVNASLNGACGLLLILGYVAVRNRWVAFHKVCMLTALAVSVVFLGCYLYYHFVVRNGTPTNFTGAGWVRPLYFGILVSHTILAALVAPLAVLTTYRGLRGTIARHTRLARWTLPIWLYVSVTGVVVYVMLYQLFPAH